MSRPDELINELNRALLLRAAARESMEELRAIAAERKKKLRDAEALVEEIQKEIQTGESGRPIMDAIERAATAALQAVESGADPKAAAAGLSKACDAEAARVVKARKSKKKEARWQDVALSEILPDDPDGCRPADIIDKVAAHLELLEDHCPTVGDLALIWFSERSQPHTLEDLHSLTEAERETLRQALAEFRRQRGWDPRIGMPDGFPLAWLKPEPTADVVIDPMAAASKAVEMPAEASDAPREWKSEDLERELERAIRPDREEFSTFRGMGCISDVQIAEVLRAIWPQAYLFVERNPALGCRHGYTIHGGTSPAFWIGARRHETLKKPTLSGPALADRVRKILGLPRVPAAVIAEAELLKAEIVKAGDLADKRPARKKAKASKAATAAEASP